MSQLDKQDNVSVRVAQVHSCGQIFEQIMHLKADELFSVTLSTDPPFEMPPLTLDIKKPFEMPPPYEQKLDLSAHIEKLEINGIEWRNGLGMFCLKCGASLFGGGE